jgi:hypothetical protein
MPLQVGSLLNDRYRITGVLGQGGMGAVYLATDESLGVPCAVKENLNLSPETDRLFRREAMLLAGLRHPLLPRVTDHFILGDEQYLVMDYIEGEDLRQRLARDGPLPERLVLDWAAQLCDALTYLHTRNPPVVHRDVKPANIKLTPAGDIALVDFGVAKPTSSEQKTATATNVFTPGFTPPEQYGLGRTDARADEYALGATLYTLLTGQAPPDSVDRLLGSARLVAPQAVRPDMSLVTAAAITRALEIKPEDRFPDVAGFKAALHGNAPAQPAPGAQGARLPAAEALVARGASAPERPATLKPVPPPARPASPPPVAAQPAAAQTPAPTPARRAPWLWLAGLGCVLLVLALAALVGGGALGFMLSRPTLTPTLAFIAAPSATSPPLPSATAPVLPTEAPASPTLAPTNTARPSTSTPTVAAATHTAAAPLVTPTPSATPVPAGTPIGSGGRIAFISNRDGQFFQIYTMNPDGSDVQQVTTDPANKWDPKWPFNGTQLAWSPDGKQLLYVAENTTGSGTDLFLINADGNNRLNLTNAPGDDFQPIWCGDGSIWFTSTRVNGVHQIFHTDLTSIGKGLGPTNFSATHKSPREYDVALYPGCQRAVFVTTLDGPPEIWRYWPDCPACFAVVRSAKDQGGNTEEPALSPDNQYLAYTLELLGSKEIVVGKLDDRTVNVQLTTTKGNSEPQWSPDGQWLVFVSVRDGNREIYRMTLAGTSQTNLTNNTATDTDPVWQAVH